LPTANAPRPGNRPGASCCPRSGLSGCGGRRHQVMSSVGSGLAVGPCRIRGVFEETEDSSRIEDCRWLGVSGRDLPTDSDVFRALLATVAPRAHVQRCALKLRVRRIPESASSILAGSATRRRRRRCPLACHHFDYGHQRAFAHVTCTGRCAPCRLANCVRDLGRADRRTQASSASCGRRGDRGTLRRTPAPLAGPATMGTILGQARSYR